MLRNCFAQEKPVTGHAGTRLTTLFLDNDGVLVDTEGVFFEANRGMLRTFGLNLSETEFSEMSLTRGLSLADMIVELGYTPEVAEAARQKRNLLYDRMLRERGSSLVIPGVLKTLKQLHERYRICVVTCCQEIHFRTIHQTSGLRPYFDCVVDERSFRRHKPYPDAYLAGLRAMNCVPEEAFAVEDSERGVRSARAAGIPTAAIPRGISEHGDFSMATVRLPDFESLPDYLSEMQKCAPPLKNRISGDPAPSE